MTVDSYVLVIFPKKIKLLQLCMQTQDV